MNSRSGPHRIANLQAALQTGNSNKNDALVGSAIKEQPEMNGKKEWNDFVARNSFNEQMRFKAVINAFHAIFVSSKRLNIDCVRKENRGVSVNFSLFFFRRRT